MQYIGWAKYVNRRIIDSTTVTVGEGAVQSDSIENSPKSKRRMTVFNAPDKFQVTMHFNCYEKIYYDENGNALPSSLYGTTEKDRFFKWYKTEHKCGVNPFEFPSILWNSNQVDSINEEEVARGLLPSFEHYIITSAVEGSKHGDDIEVKMTWETYSTDEYEVPYESIPELVSISAHDGYAVATLATASRTNLDSSAFTARINSTNYSQVFSDDVKSRQIYIIYPKISDDGEHVVEITLDRQQIKSDRYEYTFVVRRGQ